MNKKTITEKNAYIAILFLMYIAERINTSQTNLKSWYEFLKGWKERVLLFYHETNKFTEFIDQAATSITLSVNQIPALISDESIREMIVKAFELYCRWNDNNPRIFITYDIIQFLEENKVKKEEIDAFLEESFPKHTTDEVTANISQKTGKSVVDSFYSQQNK